MMDHRTQGRLSSGLGLPIVCAMCGAVVYGFEDQTGWLASWKLWSEVNAQAEARIADGDLIGAIGVFEKASDSARADKDYAALDLHLSSLYRYYLLANNPESAKRCAAEAVRNKLDHGQALAENFRSPEDPYAAMALAHIRLGEYEEALKVVAKAAEAHRPLGFANMEALSQYQIRELEAYCRFVLGGRQAAKPAYDTCRQLAKGYEMPFHMGWLDNTLELLMNDADALASLGSLAAHYQSRLGTGSGPTKDPGRDERTAALRRRLERLAQHKAPWLSGMSHFLRGRYDRARTDLQAWVALPDSRAMTERYWLACDRLGVCCERLQDLGSAASAYRNGVAVLEEQRSHLTKDAYKRRFLLGRDHAYDRLVMLLAQQGSLPEAFRFAEGAKARALLDLLGAKEVGRSPEVRQDVEHLFASAGLVSAAGASELPAGQTADDVIQTRAAAEYARRLTRLRKEDEELASMIHVEALSFEDVRGRLPADAALIEFYLTDQGGCLFFGVGGTLRVRMIPESEETIRRDVDAFRDQIVRGDAKVAEIGRRLYQRLLGDVLDTHRAQRLYVVPHGPLHYLPFAALHDGRGYLVERCTISMLPSASALKYCVGKRKVAWTSLLAYGNPRLPIEGADLPAAVQEVNAIAPLFETKVIRTGAEASETSFRAQAARYAILHLACHGHYDNDWPNQSGVLLAPDGANDGYLRAAELFRMTLGASLVTLSACETALGRLSEGDDVVGLTRAFLYAGTPAVLSTLWSVDDVATSFFMFRFYENLKGGRGKAESVRGAQLALLGRSGGATVRRGTFLSKAPREARTIQYSHPYFWAPFALVGDGE